MKARVKTLLVLLLIFCLMLPGCESLGGNGGSSLPEISYEVPSKPEKEESSKTEASGGISLINDGKYGVGFEDSTIDNLARLLGECSKFSIAAIIALADIGKQQVSAVALTRQWCAIETTVKMFAAQVELTTGYLLLPHKLACQAIKLHHVADTAVALLIHFTSAVDVRHTVHLLAD